MTVVTCAHARPHVRRVPTPPVLGDGWSWQAGRPGQIYLVGDGLHFESWSDAIRYALGHWSPRKDSTL